MAEDRDMEAMGPAKEYRLDLLPCNFMHSLVRRCRDRGANRFPWGMCFALTSVQQRDGADALVGCDAMWVAVT